MYVFREGWQTSEKDGGGRSTAVELAPKVRERGEPREGKKKLKRKSGDFRVTDDCEIRTMKRWEILIFSRRQSYFSFVVCKMVAR